MFIHLTADFFCLVAGFGCDPHLSSFVMQAEGEDSPGTAILTVVDAIHKKGCA